MSKTKKAGGRPSSADEPGLEWDELGLDIEPLEWDELELFEWPGLELFELDGLEPFTWEGLGLDDLAAAVGPVWDEIAGGLDELPIEPGAGEGG